MYDALKEIKEKYCEELEEFADQELTMSNLEIIHKLTDTIKNIEKIESMKGGRYSREDGYVNTTNSMRDSMRGDSMRDSMRGDSMRRGMSRNYSYDGYNSGRYSRADDDSIHSLQKLLNDNRLSTEEKKQLRAVIEEVKGEA